MLSAIMQKCYDYYDEIPADTGPKIIKSALYSFTAVWFYHNARQKIFHNIERPLMTAGQAALASLIYALTVPLFNYAFGDDRIVYHREVIKMIVIDVLTSVIVNYLTTGKVNLLSITVFHGLTWNLILGAFETCADFLDWVGQDGNISRDLARKVGLAMVPGSSSVFLSLNC